MNTSAARQRQRALDLLSLKTRIDCGRLARELGFLEDDRIRKLAILGEARRVHNAGNETLRSRLVAGANVDVAVLEASLMTMYRLADVVVKHQRHYDDAATACESKRSAVVQALTRQSRLDILRDDARRLQSAEAARRAGDRIETLWLQKGRSP